MSQSGTPAARTQDTSGTVLSFDLFTTGTGKAQQAVVIGDGATDGRVVTVTAAGELVTTDVDTTAAGTVTATSTVAAQAPGGFSSTALAASSSVVISVGGAGVLGVGIGGTSWTGTLVWEATYDGSLWTPVNAVQSGTGAQVSSTTVNGGWRINSGGYRQLRVRSTSAAWTGTATINLTSNVASTMMTLAEPLPAGTSVIGQVAPVRVTPTRAAATAPATSSTLLAANTSRTGLLVDATLSSVDVLLGLDGAAVSATSWSWRVGAGERWESPAGMSTVSLITWAGYRAAALTAGTGNVMVSEF